MIISNSKKFIFVHLYKTAGSSIREVLEKYESKKEKLLRKIYKERLPQHSSAKKIKEVLGERNFSRYYKFAFVRNPWDWQVSLFEYMKKDPSHHQHELAKKFNNFDEYIDWRVNEDLHLQQEFICNERGEVLVDFIGRFENLQNDFDFICQTLGIERQTLPHVNSSNHSSYKDYYSDNAKNMVEKAFKKDIELFNYKFDD